MNIKDFLGYIFPKKLKSRGMYAIKYGEYMGGFFVYIMEESTPNNIAFILMPSPTKAIYIPKGDVLFDLKNGNIELINRLPCEIYDICRANFIFYAKEEGIYAGR